MRLFIWQSEVEIYMGFFSCIGLIILYLQRQESKLYWATESMFMIVTLNITHADEADQLEDMTPAELQLCPDTKSRRCVYNGLGSFAFEICSDRQCAS